MSKKITLILAFLLFNCFIINAQHPFSLKWKVIKTNNAKFIYPQNNEGDAIRLAMSFQEVLTADTTNLSVLPKFLPIIISPTSVTSNGFTTMFPYKIFLYSQPYHSAELSSSEWFQNLIAHEYRHIVQYNMFNKGFTRFAHCVFGSYGWGALSYSVPQWFYEGDAVYAETVTTSQGRGRVADFDMPVAAMITSNAQLFPYDKVLHRSYRDMIPTAYPTGYLLTTYAKKKYGADIFKRISDRESWYSFWPFAFGCGFKHFTSKTLKDNYLECFSELKDTYNSAIKTDNTVNYENINKAQKKFYTNYSSPHFVNGDNILCVKSSMSKSSKFVLINKNGDETELSYTDASTFDTDGKITVYATEVPDLRWTLRNYSDIAIFDISKNQVQRVTKKQKYFSPAISRDGKRIVAVEFTEQRVCRIILFDLQFDGNNYSLKPISSVYSQPLEFFRNSRFLDNNKVAVVSNFGGKNSIKIIDFNNQDSQILIENVNYNVNEICVDNQNLYFVADSGRVSNVFKIDLNSKSITQITNVKYGVSMPSVKDNQLIFCNYTFKGNDISVAKTSDYVQISSVGKLNYYKPLLDKEATAKLDYISTLLPDTSWSKKSKKYGQLNDPIRIFGWIPNSNGDEMSITVNSQNNLQTLQLSVAEAYYKDPGYWRTGITAVYTGFYPIISLAASLGDNGSFFWTFKLNEGLVKEKFLWKENITSVTVSIPFYLSRFNYIRNASISAGISYYNIKNKPVYGVNDINNGNFPVLNLSGSYTWARKPAYRDFKNPMLLSLSLSAKKSLTSSMESSMLLSEIKTTLPGFFRQNYLTLTGDYLIQQRSSQNNDKLYLFDNQLYDIGGYEKVRFQTLSMLKGEYDFSMGYPDCGIPSVIWIKRFRGSLIGNVAEGELFNSRYSLISAGVQFLADFCVFRLNYDITAGFNIYKGLKSNGLDITELGIVLSLPL